MHQAVQTSYPSKKKVSSKVLVSMYKSQELAMNAAFVHSLEESANNSFERQLEKFEEEELGFTKDFINMFAYIFTSSETLKREWKIKSQKYFSPLEVRSEFYTITQAHTNNVNALRKQLWMELSTKNDINISEQKIPNTSVDLTSMINHARNNIAIEVTEKILELTLIAWIISFIAGCFGGPTGSAIGFIIGFIISIGASIWNDSNVMSNLRNQHETQSISYESLLLQLNRHTNRTYSPWTK